MILNREYLMTVLNALYQTGTSQLKIAHPSDEIGEILSIQLSDPTVSTVRFPKDKDAYELAREDVQRKYGEHAYDDLPDAETLIRALTGSGMLPLSNDDDLRGYVANRGHRDLENGHAPLVLGLDTNIFAWELPKTLGLDHRTGRTDDNGRPPTNGYALAAGVKKELDWHYKHYETRSLVNAFGSEFERLTNQPAGSNREGFLGLYNFRNLRATRNVDFVDSETGDADIVEGYSRYEATSRKDPLLLSNDHGFVERAHEAGLLAHHVSFTPVLPRKISISWQNIVDTLYLLTVLFGVLVLPKVTLYGVWNGKSGKHWQHEELIVDCRSPKIETQLERQTAILNAFNCSDHQ